MRIDLRRSWSVGVVLLALGCGQISPEASRLATRDMTVDEARADFHQLVSSIKAYYGPLEFKERRYGYKLDELAAEFEAKLAEAEGDDAYLGLFKKFLAKLEDGHVGITFPSNGTEIAHYSIPIFITPVEDHVLVGQVDESLSDLGIKVGDELLTIDGVAPLEMLATIKQYEALGNDESEKHWVFMALKRPFYMKELKPSRATAALRFKRADGTTYETEAAWRVEKSSDQKRPAFVQPAGSQFYLSAAEDLNAAAGHSLLSFAQVKPFFHTDQVIEKFGFAEVKPNAAYLKKYKVDPKKAPEIYAALYRHAGKTILLVRQAGYSTEEWSEMKTYMRTYKAILDQFDSVADALVVEQTHNPGGAYCQEFFRLFISEEKNAFVQFNNTDRFWIESMDKDWPKILEDMIDDTGPAWKRQYQMMATALEHDYDAGLPLTGRPYPMLGGFNKVGPFKDYTWKKPMLVLVDELAGSCGDLFPMLIKNNDVAKIFGKQPMGLGGNVEQVTTLHNSRAALRLTRGLFTSYREDGQYPDSVLIENQGVQPDYEYSTTVKDFRAGWVDYVQAFSDKVVEQIRE